MRHGGHGGPSVAATFLVAMLATVALVAAAGQIKVSPAVVDGRVLASFTAADTWDVQTREVLQFGQLVTFDYYVELRRPATFWDKTLATTNVKAEAKLDTLTGKYTVSRQQDGKMLKAEKREVENDVRDWLTVFEPMELKPTSALKANTDYYIQVRLFKYPPSGFSVLKILPGGSEDSSGRMSFTYLR